MLGTEKMLIAVSGFFAAVLYQAVFLGGFSILSLIVGASCGILSMIWIIRADWLYAVPMVIMFFLAPLFALVA